MHATGSAQSPPSKTRGFTLIEMLVTLALFSLTLGSLVAGLRSGASAWERIHTHQIESSLEERALEIFSNDIRHMGLLTESSPPLAESRNEDGGESLSLTTLGRRDLQRVGMNAVWWHVTYAVVEAEDGDSRDWVRRARPYVASTPMGTDERSEVLLSDLASVEYAYFDGHSMRPVWEDEESWPRAVEVTLRFSSGRELRKRVLWPLASLNQGRL